MKLDVTKMVIEIVASAVQQLSDEATEIHVNEATVLFGPGAQIDSLTLVNIIVDIEESLGLQLGREVSLTDDDAVLRSPSPYTSVGSLISFIKEVVASG